jgi:hypothetical protein
VIPFDRKKLPIYASNFEILAILPVLLVSLLIAVQNPLSNDWAIFFRRATLFFWEGENPYTSLGRNPNFSAPLRIYNPLWSLFIFTPIAIWPNILSNIILRLIAFTGYWTLIRHLSDNRWIRILFMYSAPVGMAMFEGQIEFFVLCSLFLPAHYGLWLSTIKPQSGLVLAMTQAYQVWQSSKIKLILTGGAMGIIVLITIAVFGHWYKNSTEILDAPWNVAIPWIPLKILVALGLLYLAYREQDPLQRKFWLWAISPVISLYVGIFSWVMLLLPTLKYRYLFGLFWVGTWALMFIRA